MPIVWAPAAAVGAVHDEGGVAGWYFRELRIEQLWQRTRGSGAVTVAILDRGFASLPELVIDTFDCSGTPCTPWDPDGHGTACASLVKSTAHAAPGIAPGVRLVGVSVCNAAGVVASRYVASALRFANAVSADVISCSFVLSSFPDSIATEIRLAHNRGAVVVAAAGNDGATASAFPEKAPHVVTVAAVSRALGAIPGARQGPWIDVSAPGEGLKVLRPQGGVLSTFGHTSGAAAMTSAVVALILSMESNGAARGELGRRLELEMKRSARPLADREATGAGLIDPVALVDSISLT